MTDADSHPYNPLAKENLGASVAEALLGRKPRSLGDLSPFDGAGVYALYYHGAHPAYARIAPMNLGINPLHPLYVGRAVYEGARKGLTAKGSLALRPLFKRLKEHASSIRAASDSLNVDDFTCRFLVVDDIWIPLGESLLIAKFQPVWNNLVDGFGNHDPGSGRYKGLRSRWDVLHPGRTWADKCEVRPESAEQIRQEVIQQLAAIPIPLNPNLHAEEKRGRYRAPRNDETAP